jgi:hypothetical protein
MASKSTQTIAMVAIGGFILYEFMKNKQAAQSQGPLATIGNDLSNLFGGGTGAGAGSIAGGAGGAAAGSYGYQYMYGS